MNGTRPVKVNMTNEFLEGWNHVKFIVTLVLCYEHMLQLNKRE